jgi:hypothetical protein
MSYKYRYAIVYYNEEDFEEGDRFCSSFDGSDPETCGPEWVAEEIAEYVFHNRDGWDRQWPMTFRIWTSDGTLIGDFDVMMEAVPSFCARKAI